MPKNIIICLDGTGNEVKAKEVTNVFKISELLDFKGPVQQVLYYGPGVGTLPAPSAWTRLGRKASKYIGGLALGHGMRRDVGEAYTYLMNTWEPGDKVFIFGFSRGSYTARALCGMLYRVGLLRPGSENLIPYAVRVYARRPGKDSDLSRDEGWALMDRFAKGLSREIEKDRLSFPIEFLGLFDTVKGTGIVGRDITWPYTNQLPNVKKVFHAVSIDENRRPFEQCLVPKPDKDAKGPAVEEVWFAGIHSDVGGGFAEHHGLGDISMRWILEAAMDSGLQLRPRTYRGRYTMDVTEALQPMNRNNWKWVFAGYKRRVIPSGARIHASVLARQNHGEIKYRPRLPATFTTVHADDWLGPPPKRAKASDNEFEIVAD